MDKETFIAEVQTELDYLRNTITPEQREKLIAEDFSRDFENKCLYGLTGIQKTPVYTMIGGTDTWYYQRGTDVRFEEHIFSKDLCDNWGRTAVEKYLYMIPRKNQLELLEYVKGERLTIDLYII